MSPLIDGPPLALTTAAVIVSVLGTINTPADQCVVTTSMIHNNEIVSIEEVLNKTLLRSSSRRPFTRKFIFTNRNANLKVQICGTNGSIDSCEINDHQIVVENEAFNSIHRCTWVPHVFGHERILSLEEASQRQLTYQLTRENLLIIEGKGFNPLLPALSALNPCFLNLNSVSDKPSLEGHYLNVCGSHQSITVSKAILSDHSNSVVSQFISNVPELVADSLEGSDFVCSARSSTQSDAAIIATLKYGGHTLTFSLGLDQWDAHLRVQVQNGSVAFLPHNMNRFKVTYKFA